MTAFSPRIPSPALKDLVELRRHRREDFWSTKAPREQSIETTMQKVEGGGGGGGVGGNGRIIGGGANDAATDPNSGIIAGGKKNDPS